jgi:hypothetical protein
LLRVSCRKNKSSGRRVERKAAFILHETRRFPRDAPPIPQKSFVSRKKRPKKAEAFAAAKVRDDRVFVNIY